MQEGSQAVDCNALRSASRLLGPKPELGNENRRLALLAFRYLAIDAGSQDYGAPHSGTAFGDLAAGEFGIKHKNFKGPWPVFLN